MLTEEGVVEKASIHKAVVRVERNSACEHCRSREACETLSDKKTMRVEVPNDVGAVEGDRVELAVPGTSVLKLSFMVYMLPVAALVVGAYGGELWAKGRGVVDPTLAAVAAGVLAMVGAFLLLRRIERYVSSPSSEYQPRLTRIIPPPSEEDPSPPPDDSK